MDIHSFFKQECEDKPIGKICFSLDYPSEEGQEKLFSSEDMKTFAIAYANEYYNEQISNGITNIPDNRVSLFKKAQDDRTINREQIMESNDMKDMKELNVKIDDVLYWGQQKFKLVSIAYNTKYPFSFKNEKGECKWFTKYGQIDVDTPPVLSFSKYNIEEGGATFSRPLIPPSLQKVRFKWNEQWRYGYLVFINTDHRIFKEKYYCMYPTTEMIWSDVCESFEWGNGENLDGSENDEND